MGNESLDLENPNSVTERLNKDSVHDADVLEKILSCVGGMGRYQLLLIIGVMPFGYTYAFICFVQIFITVTPQNYWCKIPELANLSMELRRNLSAPGAARGNWDHCMTYDTNWTEILHTLMVPPPETPLIPCQHGWEFEFSDIPYETVSTEREWVCDQASYVPTAQSVFFAGSLIGTAVSGWLADRFGRVPAVIVTNLFGGIGGIATTFTTGLWDFLFCRFIAGLAFQNCLLLIYILVLEFVGPHHRTVVSNLFMASTFALGSALLPWLALYIANWRLLVQITSLPMFLVLFAKWMLPESVRCAIDIRNIIGHSTPPRVAEADGVSQRINSWLVSQGRIKEAMSILKRIETINKVHIPDDVIDEFLTSSNKTISEQKETILHLFKSPPLCRATFKMLSVFMGVAVVIDGLQRLSHTFGMSLFMVFSLNEVSELVSILLVAVALDRFGRRNLTSIPNVICGVFLFTSLFVDKGVILATLANIARFFISVSVSTATQWCSEILPTPLRATAVSVLQMAALVATIFSTFIAYSGRVWNLLPILIFITAAVVVSSIALTLPETKGQSLPQSVADSEKLIREHSLCGRPENSDDVPYKKS